MFLIEWPLTEQQGDGWTLTTYDSTVDGWRNPAHQSTGLPKLSYFFTNTTLRKIQDHQQQACKYVSVNYQLVVSQSVGLFTILCIPKSLQHFIRVCLNRKIPTFTSTKPLAGESIRWPLILPTMINHHWGKELVSYFFRPPKKQIHMSIYFVYSECRDGVVICVLNLFSLHDI